MNRWPGHAGLTIVEVLVSMVIAVMLMGSLYYIYAVSAGAYKVEEQVMRAMEQARFGLEQIKRDVAAAGFQATPNSQADANVCPKPVSQLYGIYFERQGDQHQPGVNVNVRPSSVTLLGAYPTPNVYFTDSVINDLVTIQAGGASPTTQAEFDAIFTTDHMLRIVNAEQYEMYFRIASATWGGVGNPSTIRLTSNPPVSTPPDYCGIQGFGVGLEVNVVSYVRYIIRHDPRPDPSGRVILSKMDLVREELDPDRNVVLGSRLVIAEYIADLQFYDFVRDTDATAQDPLLFVHPNIENVVSVGGTGLLGIGPGARPQDLRFVTAVLTARTTDEDPDLRFEERAGAHAPLLWFDADVDLYGAARTATLATRVDLKSFKVRNVK